jgi:hypothetical protein
MRGPEEPNEFDVCYMRVDPKIVVRQLEQDDPEIQSLMVWHCKRFDVEVLRRFTKLRSLRIADWCGETLDALAKMDHLEHLHIYMLPRINDFTPLGKLKNLRALTLDAGIWSNLQLIKTYAPLGHLNQLNLIDMLGFIPEDGHIDNILSSPNLTDINLPEVHSFSELAAAMHKRPDLKRFFEPVQSWGDEKCEKCGADVMRLLGLHGTRKRKNACVQCHAKRICDHETAFEVVFQDV